MTTKTRTLVAALLILGISTVTAQIRSFEPPTARLLPHSTNGMLRILVTHVENEPVTIKFFDGSLLLVRDKIKANEFKKGFIKHYDLSSLNPGDYKVEVVCSGTMIMFDLELRSDKKIWARYWDNFLQREQVIALH